MTQPMLAERVGVSVPTIGKLEDGDPSTSLATMLRVLAVLGLAADIDLLAAQDTLGRSLQDNELKRAMPRAPINAQLATPSPLSNLLQPRGRAAPPVQTQAAKKKP